MRLGVLTGGGDCPGLNALIRGVVKRGILEFGHEFVGIENGYQGLIEPDMARPLSRGRHARHSPARAAPSSAPPTRPTRSSTRCARAASGWRRTSRSVALKRFTRARPRRAGGHRRRRHAVDRAPAGRAGAEGGRLPEDDRQRSVGHRSDLRLRHRARLSCTEAIDRLHTTAEAHERVMVVEIMGRHAGFLTLESGHRRAARTSS